MKTAVDSVQFQIIQGNSVSFDGTTVNALLNKLLD